MQVVLAARPQDGARSWFFVAAASALLAVSIAAGGGTAAAGGVAATALLASAVAVRRPIVPWQRLLALLVLVILFVPIRRYELPIEIGFQLEPYRVLVALIVLAWLASLLVDSRVRLRSTGFERPLGLILVAVFASVLVNPGRFGTLESTVVKGITFLLSFMVVLYLVMSVVRTRAIADTLVKTLVAGGAVLAVLAIIEARIGSSPFTSLHTWLPFLEPGPSFETGLDRLGTNRAFGSAEHPIALSAALVMLVPLAIYVVRVSSPVWYAALLALTVGVLSTVSRTGITMLICIGVVFLVLRGRDTRRLWPVLVPLLVVTHLAVPGTLGALKESFLPSGGLIEQQRSSEGSCSSAGRVADLGPTFAEISRKPLFGYGYGTRVVNGPGSNACILDNQWLAHLVEVGIFGFLAWLMLFIGVIRKLGRAAKLDRSENGWLLVATTASVASYAVGMLTLDALTFVQVTFLLFIILGIGGAMAAISTRPRGVVAPPS